MLGENSRIALISATAAIAGAGVAGLATYLAVREGERAEDRRVERRLDQQATGAARSLMTEFDDAGIAAGTLAQYVSRNQRRFADAGDLAVRLELSREDRRLLLSRLTPREYLVVTSGVSAAAVLHARLRQQRQRDAIPIDRITFRAWTELFFKARDALRRVAHYPPDFPTLGRPPRDIPPLDLPRLQPD
jgi:hypothetical protein